MTTPQTARTMALVAAAQARIRQEEEAKAQAKAATTEVHDITDNIQTALVAGAASVQPVTSHDGIAYVAVPEGYKNMTQKFRFYGKAEIRHLNARKEGPDDDKQLAVDVKLRAVTTMAVLHYFDDMLGQLFYTDIGAVRNTMIGPIPMKHELEDYRLEVMGGTHHGVKLKKFALEAMDNGMVSITFQARRF